MELVLLIVQVIVALLLIGFVLLQRSESDGFGMGSGSGGGLMSSRGQANFMTRSTAILAFVFMANSLLLTVLTTQDSSASLVDDVVRQQPMQVPLDGTTNTKSLPDKKTSSDKKGLDFNPTINEAVNTDSKGVYDDAKKDAGSAAKAVGDTVKDAVKGADDVTVQPGAIEVSPPSVTPSPIDPIAPAEAPKAD